MKRLIAALFFMTICFILPFSVYAAESPCNLYDVQTMPKTAVTISGAPTVGWGASAAGVVVPVQANTEYTVSVFNGASLIGSTLFRVGTIAEQDSTQTINHKLLSAYAPITINSGANAKYMIIQIHSTKINTALPYLMVTEGNQVPTEYISYDAMCGKQCDIYESATGNSTQNGTPTPNNYVKIDDYTQGKMVLRSVGTIADSYDATTGKITRRVGVRIYDGTESIERYSSSSALIVPITPQPAGIENTKDVLLSTNFVFNSSHTSTSSLLDGEMAMRGVGTQIFMRYESYTSNTIDNFKSWLAQQYTAGTPMVVYYPLDVPFEEDWPSVQCPAIKVATTKYVDAQFAPIEATLQATVNTIDSVVSRTITQTAQIATLQNTKQTRPDETCPAGKKCLLVEDEQGILHWYVIAE